MAVKQELRDAEIQYTLMFPARLRIMVDGNTTFFADPNEAWDWLELYKYSRDGLSASASEGKAPKRSRRKRDNSGWRMNRPTRSQTDQDRKAAIKVAGSLGEQRVETGTDGEATDHTASGAESAVAAALGETLPGVTPRTADDL